MTEIEELRRWCVGAGHCYVVATIDRWLNMPAEDRESLRKRWELEDEENEKQTR